MKVNEIFDPHAIHNLANPKDKEVTKVTKVEDLAAILKAQCSEVLKAYKIGADPLYRGIKDADSSEQVIITAIRKDRKPVEMKGNWHEILHQAFIEYGLKATRKNAIFCTTSKRLAEDWGNVYIIFPKDGWSVTIFEKFVDDYTFYKLSALKHHRAIEDAKSNQEKYDYIGDCLSDMKAKNVTTAEGLGKVIAAGYEDILLTGSSYIGVKLGSPLLPKLSKLLGVKL